jgi:radical SAM protein with 4Fe4S-binding SPASM domain
LRDWRPFYMEVTLYGSTRETFERVTGVPGSFERSMRGIELIDEAGIQYNLKSMIMTLNVHELFGMREYAEGRGANFRFDAVIQPRLDGQRDVRYLRLSPEEVVDLDVWASGFPKTDDLFTCGAGRHAFHITADGQLRICSGVRTPSYDLTRGTFLEGWNEFIPKIRQQKVSKDMPCIECDKQILCGQCPGIAEVENGDPESVVEYLCQIGHLRAHALDLSERSLVRHE